MPWTNLARLLSILRRNRVDPREVEVYVDAEAIKPRPRNHHPERFETEQDAGDDYRYDYDDDED